MDEVLQAHVRCVPFCPRTPPQHFPEVLRLSLNPSMNPKLLPLIARAVAALLAATLTLHAALPDQVPIGWLGGTPAQVPTGVSFGVPFARGAVQKTQAFTLMTSDGRALPVQTWPLAYWPDGSLKWTGVATVGGPDVRGDLRLVPAQAANPPATQIRVQRSDTTYEVDAGRVKVRLATGGSKLVDSIVMDGREIARDGVLVCIAQEGPEGDASTVVPRQRYGTRIDRVTVEQGGPVRAVLKIEGMHLGLSNHRAWLPFVVRLYLYAGQEQIRMVHTVVFDGDDQRDFIRGLGLVFDVPFREQVQNRHVRFAGEGGGLWAEPVQPMIGRGGRFASVHGETTDVYPAQADGRRVPNREQLNERGQSLLADWAVWDDFKLVQPNADGFTVHKRTNAQSVWLPAGAGRRSAGFAFVGDVSGGLGVSVKNFWQSYPTALEVHGASSGSAKLTAWLWSPDAPAMDLRHYDTRAHGLEAVYEDVQPGFSTAHGIARTSELMLFPTSAVPTREQSVQFAQVGAAPPLLVCTPKYMHSAQAFGTWGLEDRSTPAKQAIESRLATTLDFYLKQPESQRWYGFWDFGDVCIRTTTSGMCGVTIWVAWRGPTRNSGRICGFGIVS